MNLCIPINGFNNWKPNFGLIFTLPEAKIFPGIFEIYLVSSGTVSTTASCFIRRHVTFRQFFCLLFMLLFVIARVLVPLSYSVTRWNYANITRYIFRNAAALKLWGRGKQTADWLQTSGKLCFWCYSIIIWSSFFKRKHFSFTCQTTVYGIKNN